MSYTKPENNLRKAVSEFPSYASRIRSVSDVSKVDGYQEGAYKAYRTIKTVYIPKWVSLSNADKEKIISERNK